MNEGWIKLWRMFLNWEWYEDTNVVRVFLHCLLRANFKDQKHQGTLIKRGQFVTGREKFASQVNLSVQEVRTAWSKLESTNEITIESTNRGSLITVCKYDDYQKKDGKSNHPDNQQSANDQPTSNQQSTTNKNEKKDKNEKNTGSIDLFGNSSTATKEVNEKGQQLYYGKTVDELWDWFWNHYPDRGPARNPKKRSKEIFYKLIEKKGIDPRRIVIGTKVFQKSVEHLEGEDRRSIPMSSTWLNGEEYNDFYEKFEASRRPMDRPTLTKEGYLTRNQAEKYALENFREELDDCLTAFQRVSLPDGETLYKPLKA